MTFTSAAYSQLRLNQLDPKIFPIQKYSCTADQVIGGACAWIFLRSGITYMHVKISPDCPLT